MAITNQQIINPIDFKPNVAIGITLPMTKADSNIFNQSYITFDQVKANLKNLLLTEPGERIMYPTYGLGLKKKLFEPNTKKYATDIEQDIKNAVTNWMSYIIIKNITITQDEYTITIVVNFIFLNNEGSISMTLVNDIV